MTTEAFLYIGTEDGLIAYTLTGIEVSLVRGGLNGNAVRGIARHPADSRHALIACGLRGWGLHRTRDAGRSFESVGFGDVWCGMWHLTYGTFNNPPLYTEYPDPLPALDVDAERRGIPVLAVTTGDVVPLLTSVVV